MKRAGCIFSAFCLLVLLAMLLPAIEQTRDAARYAETHNNLRQMALAAMNYESAFMRFPAATEFDPTYGTATSWSFNLLNFMESTPLPVLLDRRLPWDHLGNSHLYSHEFWGFVSPFETIVVDENALALTHYSGTELVFGSDRQGANPADIEDQTPMIGEVCDGYVPWGKPSNVRKFVNGIHFDANSFGSRSERRSGAIFALAGGATKFIVSKEDRPVLNQTLPGLPPEPVKFDLSSIRRLTHTVHYVGPNRMAYIKFFDLNAVPMKRYEKDKLSDGPPVDDEHIKTLSKLDNVAAVSLTDYSKISNSAFSSLATMRDLRLLSLSGIAVDKERLRLLAAAPSLETLLVDSKMMDPKTKALFEIILPDCELILAQ